MARATGAEISLHGLHESDGWAIDVDRLRSEVRPTTRLIIVNTPHNPTGMMVDRTTYDGLIEIAQDNGIRLFMDEVYRGLEFDETDRLAAGADVLPTGISLGVMSKSYAMAGLRIGWIATHDRDLLAQLAAFKDYTTICSSGPSEILAIIALRARDRVLERSRGIIAANLELVDGFFEDYLDRFTWIRPSGGSIGFPRLTVPGVAIDEWAAELVKAEGVLLVPGSVFGYSGNHFRLGFGRTDLPKALERLEAFAAKTPALSCPSIAEKGSPAVVRPPAAIAHPTAAPPAAKPRASTDPALPVRTISRIGVGSPTSRAHSHGRSRPIQATTAADRNNPPAVMPVESQPGLESARPMTTPTASAMTIEADAFRDADARSIGGRHARMDRVASDAHAPDPHAGGLR